MRKRYTPQTHSKYEQESHIQEFRLDRGLFIHELCELANTTSSTIYSLANGTTPPVYINTHKEGQIKPVTRRILEALDASFEEVFPRYACVLNSNSQLVRSQILFISHSKYNPKTTERLNKNEFWNIIYKILNSFDERKVDIFLRRTLNDEPFDCIGKHYKIVASRARQIYLETLPKIKTAIKNLSDEEREILETWLNG